MSTSKQVNLFEIPQEEESQEVEVGARNKRNDQAENDEKKLKGNKKAEDKKRKKEDEGQEEGQDSAGNAENQPPKKRQKYNNKKEEEANDKQKPRLEIENQIAQNTQQQQIFAIPEDTTQQQQMQQIIPQMQQMLPQMQQMLPQSVEGMMAGMPEGMILLPQSEEPPKTPTKEGEEDKNEDDERVVKTKKEDEANAQRIVEMECHKDFLKDMRSEVNVQGWAEYLAYNSPAKDKRRIWGPRDTQKLIDGIKEFGTNWKPICEKYFQGANRSNVDLKDRWRNVKSHLMRKLDNIQYPLLYSGLTLRNIALLEKKDPRESKVGKRKMQRKSTKKVDEDEEDDAAPTEK